jgi:hypothetical protein
VNLMCELNGCMRNEIVGVVEIAEESHKEKQAPQLHFGHHLPPNVGWT